MLPLRLVVAAFVSLSLLVVLGVILAVVLSLHTSSQLDRVWCPALRQLTSRPVPYPAHPAANPSRLADYRLYTELVQVRDRLGC